MYTIGQLREETNVCWDLEFKGYHGLLSVNDIPRMSATAFFRKGLTKPQLDHVFEIIKFIVPLMKDPICFQLITMIMLLDTSNLIENLVTPLNVVHTSIQPAEVRILSLADVMYDSDEIPSPWNKCNDTNLSSNVVQKKSNALEEIRSRNEKRFHEIRLLQKYYTQLLRNRCIHSNNPKLRRLGDTDLCFKRTVVYLKQLAQYELLELSERSIVYS